LFFLINKKTHVIPSSLHQSPPSTPLLQLHRHILVWHAGFIFKSDVLRSGIDDKKKQSKSELVVVFLRARQI